MDKCQCASMVVYHWSVFCMWFKLWCNVSCQSQPDPHDAGMPTLVSEARGRTDETLHMPIWEILTRILYA